MLEQIKRDNPVEKLNGFDDMTEKLLIILDH